MKLASFHTERHSIFNGWHLIAQQDYYSEFHQTADGNKTEWKHQTHYAVTQPNGQVLALFNPEGKTGWYKPQTTLWGLDLEFDRYASPKPLNPNLLFAGQYFDEESGLAYNRFRYYDPETASYLCSDPIGLNGGETPYGYVSNPWDWVDPFGLSACKKPISKYEVGIFDDLQRRSVTGDQLDIHHLMQKHPAGQIIDEYNPKTAPSIALPRSEHKLIPTLKGNYSGSARELLAKDIKDLRKYTNAPNSAIRELIALNKSMFPSAFIK